MSHDPDDEGLIGIQFGADGLPTQAGRRLRRYAIGIQQLGDRPGVDAITIGGQLTPRAAYIPHKPQRRVIGDRELGEETQFIWIR